LEEHEAMTARHQETAGLYVPQDRPGPARAIGRGPEATWASAGAYMVDLIRARGYMSDPRTGQRLPADPEAQSRINYALANQTTADTPGLLPHVITGDVVNLIDASRPFITSIG